MLRGPAAPLFLQFKLSDCLLTRNANEAGILSLPYYRMHIRPSGRSRQHQLLLDLEGKGEDVLYCAPAFHTIEEFNKAYLDQRVCERSVWIPPSAIGEITDDKTHYAAFQDGNATEFYFCSTPQRIATNVTFKGFVSRVLLRLESQATIGLESQDFVSLAKLMRARAATHYMPFPIPDEQRLSELPPINQVATLARVIYDTQLFVVGFNERQE